MIDVVIRAKVWTPIMLGTQKWDIRGGFLEEVTFKGRLEAVTRGKKVGKSIFNREDIQSQSRRGGLRGGKVSQTSWKIDDKGSGKLRPDQKGP